MLLFKKEKKIASLEKFPNSSRSKGIVLAFLFVRSLFQQYILCTRESRIMHNGALLHIQRQYNICNRNGSTLGALLKSSPIRANLMMYKNVIIIPWKKIIAKPNLNTCKIHAGMMSYAVWYTQESVLKKKLHFDQSGTVRHSIII